MVLVSIMWQFGRYRCVNDICGIFFGGVYRAHDEVWHIALARTAFDKFPFRVPIFSGASLSGYHFLFSYLLFLFSKIKIKKCLKNILIK